MNLESKARINSLISAANATTGKADTDLTSAVGALIAGFGQGANSGGGASGIYMARITPASYIGDLPITHNLGTTDILYVATWAESFGDYDVSQGAGTLCKMWAKTDIKTRRGGNGFSAGYGWSEENQYADGRLPNTASYETLKVTDENTIALPRCQSGSTSGYHAGITYTVLVIAANAEV